MADYPNVTELAARYDILKRKAVKRDQRMKDVLAVRTNESELVFDGLFPSEWPKPIVANFIDVVAQDSAEMVGVMPTISAAGDSILDERTRTRADKLTKIANFYPYASRVGTRLVQGADRFNSYGFLAFRVEANYEDKRPHIHIDDPFNSYYEKDRWGNVVTYVRRYQKKASDLAAMFPEYRMQLMPSSDPRKSDALLEVVQWWDKEKCVLFVNERATLVLAWYANPISRVPVAVAERPTIDDETRGQFDDVLWVFAAKARLAMLQLEAVQKAVEAPIALPQDVQEMAFGPDAILRSQTPERIRRVPLELPQSTIIEGRVLDEEMRMGARFPEARSGNIDASIVTGRGVQALMGGFDARIKTAQSAIGDALTEAISMCLEMDEALWGDVDKVVQSSHNGTPYELKYNPVKDIKGNYNVVHEYGVMAGLDPNRALVWGLQGLGAGLFSKSFLRRNLPVSMNVAEEEKVIDVEKLREAALASVQSYVQLLPQLAASGQNPDQVISRLADLIAQRKKGVAIEDAIEKAFAPPEPPAGASPNPAEQGQPGAEQGQMMPSPGGSGGQSYPPMQQLLAQLGSSGSSNMSARMMRSVPAA